MCLQPAWGNQFSWVTTLPAYWLSIQSRISGLPFDVHLPCLCAGIAGQLNALGVIGHFANVVGAKLTTMNLGWPTAAAVLSVAYYGLHYMFASQTAHVGALYSAFLAMMLSAGELATVLSAGGLAVSKPHKRPAHSAGCWPVV